MSAFRLLNKYPEGGQLGGTRAAPIMRQTGRSCGDREGDRLWLGCRPVGEERIRPGEGHPQADGLAHPWTLCKAHGGGLPVTFLADLN